MAYSGKERRNHPRLAVKFPIKFRIKNGQDDMHVFEASGRDISAGGLCMEMSLLQEGAMEKVYKSKGSVEIEIDMPDMGRSIKIMGEIMWMRKDQGNDILGIFFKDIPKEERIMLSTYVNQRLK